MAWRAGPSVREEQRVAIVEKTRSWKPGIWPVELPPGTTLWPAAVSLVIHLAALVVLASLIRLVPIHEA